MFTRSITFLKDEAIKVICQRTGDDHFSPDDVQRVLTVPAIWTPEAAYQVMLKYHVLSSSK